MSRLCLGAMMFGNWGNPDHDAAYDIINTALDAGVNVIDTADMYADGESEEIVGEAIEGRRSNVVLATKAHWPMGSDRNERGNSRRWIVRACEASLRRLRTDYIDIYQIHRPDPDTEIDETLAALSDLVHSGKVLYLGSSTFPASEIVEAQWVARSRGRERFVCEQPPYSMLMRGIENDTLPACQRHGLGVLVWGPLSGGWLSGRWRKGATSLSSARVDRPGTGGQGTGRLPLRYDLSREENIRKLSATDALADLAESAGLTLVELAIAWVLVNPAVTGAIIGPRTMDHLLGQLGAADLDLDDDLLDRIDEIVVPGMNFTQDDAGYLTPHVSDARRRRRVTSRAAGPLRVLSGR